MGAHKPKTPGSAGAIAGQIVADAAEADLARNVEALGDGSKSAATRAARVVEEVIRRKPELGVPHVERLVELIVSDQPRLVQTSASALPVLARIAPAKVAKHLNRLTASFDSASDAGKDGLVRTYAALCNASIAYQKRLIDVLEQALAGADGKTLDAWAMLVLPVLKGEPHAVARAVVERRLEEIPRSIARKLAGFLGVKLRPAGR
jgi:hypothetical protein